MFCFSGTTVATVSCTDADANSPFNSKSYSISQGDDSGAEKFSIHSSTGVITTTSTGLDYETKTYYELIIHVTDNTGGSPINTGTATVIVTVCANEIISISDEIKRQRRNPRCNEKG